MQKSEEVFNLLWIIGQDFFYTMKAWIYTVAALKPHNSFNDKQIKDSQLN